jgi:flagellar hook assembly protein FlgD
VFTPGDGTCNELFSAYGVDLPVEESSSCRRAEDNDSKCARFVLRVNFHVYNVWGKEVYDYVGQLGDENGIYIKWDGRDKNGSELTSGVYYYTAEVTFDVVDPSKRVQLQKGWIHLIRYTN